MPWKPADRIHKREVDANTQAIGQVHFIWYGQSIQHIEWRHHCACEFYTQQWSTWMISNSWHHSLETLITKILHDQGKLLREGKDALDTILKIAINNERWRKGTFTYSHVKYGGQSSSIADSCGDGQVTWVNSPSSDVVHQGSNNRWQCNKAFYLFPF